MNTSLPTWLVCHSRDTLWTPENYEIEIKNKILAAFRIQLPMVYGFTRFFESSKEDRIASKNIWDGKVRNPYSDLIFTK